MAELTNKPRRGKTIDGAKYSKLMHAPRFVEVQVTDTYQFLDLDGKTKTFYANKGDTLFGRNKFGFPDATAGDLNLIY